MILHKKHVAHEFGGDSEEFEIEEQICGKAETYLIKNYQPERQIEWSFIKRIFYEELSLSIPLK